MDRKNTMIQLSPSQVTRQIRELFDPDAPAGLRCFAVLDGQSVGQIWVDALPSPSSGIVREAFFGSLYFGGTPDAGTLSDMISSFKEEGDVLVGLWPDDDLWQKLPPDPNYVGSVLEFGRRIARESVSLSSEPLPEKYKLRRLDSDLFKHSMMADYFKGVFGSVEKALDCGIGLCLMRDKEILSEGAAGPSANGLIEIGVETRKQHQRQGHATWVCAHLVRECEELGFSTYWNCDSRNPASLALARKLGYGSEKEYKLVAWLR
jgi:RimJ/RimL family protein N-acetyltransferase